MPLDPMVETELLQIADFLEERSGTLGATRRSKSERLSEALEHVRRTLCPQATKIAALSGSLPGELSIILLDVIICAAMQLPFPPTKICQLIAKEGISKFCGDPKLLL